MGLWNLLTGFKISILRWPLEDLETKLDEARANAEEMGTRLTETQTEHQAQAVKLAQVGERLLMIEEERNRYEQQAEQMRNERDTAREDAAKLRGLVEGLQAQVKDLMQTLGSRQHPDDENKRSKASDKKWWAKMGQFRVLSVSEKPLA